MKKIILVMVLGCFWGGVFGQVPNWEWARSCPTGGGVQTYAITTDFNSNVYMTGCYYQSISFGPYTVYDSSMQTVFIAKYDSAGNALWVRTSHGINTGGYGTNLSADLQGNIYMAGNYFTDSIKFGNYNLSGYGTNKVFLVKYDSLGNLQWARTASNIPPDCIYGLGTYGSEGDIYLSGNYAGAITFGSITLNGTPPLYEDVFLVKYDNAGNVIWAKTSTGNSYDESNGLALDNLGNIYLGGEFYSDTLAFGSSILINIDPTGNSSDYFIAKYDPSGNVLWARSGGGNSTDELKAISINNSGKVFITGSYLSSVMNFGSLSVTHTGSYPSKRNLFFAEYDFSGNAIWAKQAGGHPIDDIGANVTADIYGNSYFSGRVYGGILLIDTINHYFSGSGPRYIVKFDSQGNAIWVKSLKSGWTQGNSIKATNNNELYIDGNFNDSIIVFDNDTLVRVGGQDAYLAKLYLNQSTGVSELLTPNSLLLLSPNPFTSTTTLTFSDTPKNASLKVLNILGEVVFQAEIKNLKSEINLSNQPNGMYFVNVQTEKGMVSRKVIKQ